MVESVALATRTGSQQGLSSPDVARLLDQFVARSTTKTLFFRRRRVATDSQRRETPHALAGIPHKVRNIGEQVWGVSTSVVMLDSRLITRRTSVVEPPLLLRQSDEILHAALDAALMLRSDLDGQ